MFCQAVKVLLVVVLLAHSTTANVGACLAACQRGTSAIQAFCRGVPLPQVRAACWAVQFAGPAACSGFCYLYYTSYIVDENNFGLKPQDEELQKKIYEKYQTTQF